MLGHLRMNVDQAIDALFAIASGVFPEEDKEELDRDKNTKNLKEAIEEMLQTVNVPLDTKMNDPRCPMGTCKVFVLPSVIVLY